MSAAGCQEYTRGDQPDGFEPCWVGNSYQGFPSDEP